MMKPLMTAVAITGALYASLSLSAEAEVLTSPLSCLAYNIYHEARGEGFIGMLAVADVTLNRVDSQYFPDDICGVVKQGGEKRHRCHFSWYCDGLSDRIGSSTKEEEAYAKASSIAFQMVYHAEYRGITEGSTHYHATEVKPVWISDRGMKYVAKVNNHIFYKWH